MRKYLLLLINLTLICFNLFCYNQFFDWSKMTGKMYIEFKPYEDSYYLEKGMYALGTGKNSTTIIEHYSVTSGKMKELMSLPASETAKFNKFEVIIGRNGSYGLSRRFIPLNYVFQINKNNVYNMLIDKSFGNLLSLWANHYGVNYLNDNSYSNSFLKLKEYVENNKEFLSKYIKNKEYTGEFIKELKGKIYFKDKLIEKYSNLDIKIIENGKAKKYRNKSIYYKALNENIYILPEEVYKHFENKFKKLDFSEYSLKLSYTDSLFLEGNEFGEYITTSSTNFYYYMLNLSAFITE